MSFTAMPKGEKITRSFKMRGSNAVEVVATVKPHEDSAVVYRWEYVQNFQDCTPQQVMLQAARNLHVRNQDKFRKAATAEGANIAKVLADSDFEIMWIKKFLEAERQAATPLQRAQAAKKAMSDEERREFYLQMKAEFEAGDGEAE